MKLLLVKFINNLLRKYIKRQRFVPVGRDFWVCNHNGLQVKSSISQVSMGTHRLI